MDVFRGLAAYDSGYSGHKSASSNVIISDVKLSSSTAACLMAFVKGLRRTVVIRQAAGSLHLGISYDEVCWDALCLASARKEAVFTV